ncbi:hypothetical protein NUW58_g922 [Xylaria curta]|uniref:Uncharacterized protein n=1 Tax=Xylaria curta TaxID=42375 RepID=A0ACC1PMY1_9PEZI|nr:hypothetical protein NUW58_g922 [Xylaria curta]
MMFNLKSSFLLGLVAVSVASPTPSFDLVARAKIPDPLVCDGTTWTKDQIYNSIQQARALENSNYAYPKRFYNNENIFGTPADLWEFPLADPVWRNGVSPGTFRVIVKDNYDYVGVTNKDVGSGGTVHKC